MRPNTNELNALLNTLHKVNDCVVMPAYQILIKQSLCILKSVLRGIVSSLTGCNIQFLFDWECKSIKSNRASEEGGRAVKKSRALLSQDRRCSEIFTSAK